MTPERELYIHTVRATNPTTGEAKMSSFVARNEQHAKFLFKKFHHELPLDEYIITISVPKVNDCTFTEAHCARFGDIIQKVSHSRTNNDFYNDNHPVVTPELVRGEYNPVNHSYTCFDPDGNKVYLSPYDWVIIKKKEN